MNDEGAELQEMRRETDIRDIFSQSCGASPAVRDHCDMVGYLPPDTGECVLP